MIQLGSCKRCGGFLALALRACPHCDAPVARAQQIAFGLAGVLGGGAVSMTLMACYGPACTNDMCSEPSSRPITEGELAQLQETIGAGSWIGESNGTGATCTMTSVGSVQTPRTLTVTLESGSSAFAAELQENVTNVSSVDVGDDRARVELESSWATLEFSQTGDGVATATVGSLTCNNLKKQ